MQANGSLVCFHSSIINLKLSIICSLKTVCNALLKSSAQKQISRGGLKADINSWKCNTALQVNSRSIKNHCTEQVRNIFFCVCVRQVGVGDLGTQWLLSPSKEGWQDQRRKSVQSGRFLPVWSSSPAPVPGSAPTRWSSHLSLCRFYIQTELH